MRDERGFSLVEVLVALLVLTVVITVSLGAFLERNRRLQQATEMVLAYQALANEAEYRRRIPFDELDNPQKWPTTFLSDPDVLEALESAETIVAVELIKPGVKNVTMTVRWRNGERSARLGIVRVDTGGSPLW